MEKLRREMVAYYKTIRADKDFPPQLKKNIDLVWLAMDDWHREHPDANPAIRKARLHELIAERFEPVLFPHSPFFYEMGLRPSQNWGTPDSASVAGWDIRIFGRLCKVPEYKAITFFGDIPYKLWQICPPFDYDHHCIGYTRMLKIGVNGVIEEVDRRLGRSGLDNDQKDFLNAAHRSLRAVLKVADRFREAAERIIRQTNDDDVRRFMTMIANAARHIPANPPRTFYEGLAMTWFLREVTATFEGIGISVIGHLDRVLINLYRRDLAEGRLTEEEASDIVARHMLPTDVKFFVDENSWPETSTCLELGGCDAEGRPLFNELTRLFIETHAKHNLVNPKLNCRVAGNSPTEYLELMGKHVLAGHNVFSIMDDEILIPASVRAGKTEAESRLYVNGGCQETIVEGVEHSAGGCFYFNMVRILDLCLLDHEFPDGSPRDAELEKFLPEVIAGMPDFESLYCRVLDTLKETIKLGADWFRIVGYHTRFIHPCPLFSTTLLDCIERGTDYTAGGARYNPAGIALVGLGTVVDSLTAIRHAVYDEGWLSMDALRKHLANNWAGAEDIRQRIISLPKYGHGEPEVDRLAARISHELAEFCRTLVNERGGHYQPSFFVYYLFQWMGKIVRATPDGRRAGDLLSQGCAPGKLRSPKSLTDIIRSVSMIDFVNYPGNAVLDMQLPLSVDNGMPLSDFVSLLRTFVNLGGPTLQPNCVSVDALRDAKAHPDKHRDLLVRISGLSAWFVTLHEDVQDEIIERYMVNA